MTHQQLVDRLNEALSQNKHPMDEKSITLTYRVSDAIDALTAAGAPYSYIITADGLVAHLFASSEEAKQQWRILAKHLR
jgi:hypothetical protein